MGWATGGRTSRRTAAYTTTPAGQASRLTKTFRALIRARKRLRVGMMVWFSWRDRLPLAGERDWWGLHTGLFDVAGNAKPAWPALVRVTGGDRGLSAPPSQPGGPVLPPPEPPPPSGGGGGGGGGGGDCPLIVVCP
jgi:hypothetical protein